MMDVGRLNFENSQTYIQIQLRFQQKSAKNSVSMLGIGPYNIRLKPVVKNKPKFVPALPPDSDQIRRLLQYGSSDDTEQLLSCIYRRIKDDGILYCLVNRLYEMRELGLAFYVPELVYLAVKKNCQPIIKLLVDFAQVSLQMFCLVYWNVQAFGYHMKLASLEAKERLDKLEKEMRLSMYHSLYNIECISAIKPGTKQLMLQDVRKFRPDHFAYCCRFIYKLVTTSLHLKQIEEGKRKTVLKEQIVKANNSLRLWSAKHKQFGIPYHNGIMIPFRKGKDKFNSTLVVNIVENECSCFNTRKRVPYRIVLETVDVNDFNTYERKPRGSKDAQKQGANTSITGKDTFLDDIPSIASGMLLPEQTSVQSQNLKYAQLGKFVMDLQQAEQQKRKAANPMLTSQRSNNQRHLPVSRNNLNSSRNMGFIKRGSIMMQIPSGKDIDFKTYQRNLKQFQAYFPKQKNVTTRKSLTDMTKLQNKYRVKRRPTMRDTRNKNTLDLEDDMPKIRRYYSQGKIKPLDLTKFREELQSRLHESVIRKLQMMGDQDEAYEEKQDDFWVEADHIPIKKFGPWEELWDDKIRRFRKQSEFAHFPSYRLRNCIVKGGDDLRQEIVCMQLIYKFQQIFDNAKLDLYLRPYEIIVLNESSGILEFVTNSISIDALKKNEEGFTSMYDFYNYMFPDEKFKTAQLNFVKSLAAYSLLTYLMQVKDRHNGNILLDCEGHIIHIDFGFIFSISPGGFSFETSPFKLTAEYVQLMEGQNSDVYRLFKQLFYKGFEQLRRHTDAICNIVEIMSEDSDLPCFAQFNLSVFRERFKVHYDVQKFKDYCESLIEQSCFNWRTVQYDYFQHLTNDIMQ